MTTLHVEAAVVGRKRAGSPSHELAITLPPGPTTLSALIDAIVRAEVAAFKERANDARFVQVLTSQALEEGLTAGVVRSGGRDVAADINPDDAVRTAHQAQQDGLFKSFVDKEPIDELDAVFALRDGTKVLFLRLVALAGG